MRVAILFGNRINAWHSTLFREASGQVKFVAFTSTEHLYPIDDLGIPVRALSPVNEVGSVVCRKRWNLRYRREHSEGFEFPLADLHESLSAFDILNSCETWTAHTLWALEAKRQYGSKLVVTVWDDIPFDGETKPVWRDTKKRCHECADAYVVYTGLARRGLVLEGVQEDRIHRVNPSVDLAQFCPGSEKNPLRESLNIAKEDLVLAYFGRLVWEKGIFTLLDALAEIKLRGEIRNLKVLFVGSGRDQAELKHRVRRAALKDHVRFVPSVAYAEMPQTINLADIVLLPSIPTRTWQEQFGMAVLEAMACGKPCIVSQCGGMPEMVGQDALLIPPGDYPALANSIMELAGSPRRRQQLGERARTRAEQQFSAIQNAERLVDIYQSL